MTAERPRHYSWAAQARAVCTLHGPAGCSSARFRFPPQYGRLGAAWHSLPVFGLCRLRVCFETGARFQELGRKHPPILTILLCLVLILILISTLLLLVVV
jgi:hypothetical protein